MKYCERLLHTVHLFPEYVSPCVMGGEARPVPLFPYFGGPFDAKAYRDFVMQTLEAMQKESSLCTHCVFQKNDDALSWSDCQKKFKIHFLTIEANRHLCNLRCVYCYSVKEPQEYAYYNLEPFFRDFFASEMAEVTTVFWIEGEPTLSRDFANFCREFHERGLNQFFLTNATRYSPEIALSLAAGNGHISLSLDSGSRETYAAVKGADAFETVRFNAKRYARAGGTRPSITLKYILLDANANPREILLFLLHCIALRTPFFSLAMDVWTLRKHAEPVNWITMGAFAVRAGKLLGLTCEPVAKVVPPRVCAALEAADVEAFAQRQGYPGFEEYVLPLLAAAAGEIGDYLEYDSWEGFPGWARDGEKGLFVANINTQEAFTKGLEHIRADYGDRAFIMQPYTCICVPREGRLDCSLDEYRFRKSCIHWGHIFNKEELREVFNQVASASGLECLLRDKAYAKHLTALQAKAEELRDKDVFFWGCGAAYEGFKGFFSEAKPKAILLSPEYAQKECRTHIDGLSIRSSETISAEERLLPVIVFARAEHTKGIKREAEAVFGGQPTLCLHF
ncbi:MAG: hypothetical protein DELT_02662 [Desulfovibrio sp.]